MSRISLFPLFLSFPSFSLPLSLPNRDHACELAPLGPDDGSPSDIGLQVDEPLLLSANTRGRVNGRGPLPRSEEGGISRENDKDTLGIPPEVVPVHTGHVHRCHRHGRAIKWKPLHRVHSSFGSRAVCTETRSLNTHRWCTYHWPRQHTDTHSSSWTVCLDGRGGGGGEQNIIQVNIFTKYIHIFVDK